MLKKFKELRKNPNSKEFQDFIDSCNLADAQKFYYYDYFINLLQIKNEKTNQRN